MTILRSLRAAINHLEHAAWGIEYGFGHQVPDLTKGDLKYLLRELDYGTNHLNKAVDSAKSRMQEVSA